MKILTLIENTSATEKLFTEHGLSFYIEHNGSKIILDTGASEKFAKNAERMLVDVKGINAAVISHNHFDHTGGLDALLRQNQYVRVFAKQAVLGDYYKKAGLFRVPVGLGKSYFERNKERFVLFENFQEITDGVYLLSDESTDERHSMLDRTLQTKKDGRYCRDRFDHELFMAVFPSCKISDGCVIISSCSHRGIMGIINTVRFTWPGVAIHGFVGGLHLSNFGGKQLLCTDEYIAELADEIMKADIGPVYTCHCTGQRGYEKLKVHLGDQIQYLQTGEELEF